MAHIKRGPQDGHTNTALVSPSQPLPAAKNTSPGHADANQVPDEYGFTTHSQAEEAPHRAEETFRLLFANNPQPMWIYDLETLAFLDVNDAAIAHYGYTHDEFLSMRITDIRPAEDLDRLLQDVRQARPALQRASSWRHRRKDGQIIDVEISSHTLSFARREAVMVCAHDVTAQKNALAALQASEERLRTVVTNAPIVLFAVDRNGIFTLSDGKGLEVLGIKPGQHVGQSYVELYGHLPDSITAMERVLAGEAATTVNEYRGVVFETRWVPSKDADGTVSGVIGVSADITERVQMERERAEMHERERASRAEAQERAAQLEAIFEAMADAVFVIDQDAQIVHTNAALQRLREQIGYTDLRTRSLEERGHAVVPRDERDVLLAQDLWPTNRILKGEVLNGPQAVDVTIRTRDGNDLHLNITGAPVRNRAGDVRGGIVVIRDVTERRRLEQRTRAALDALLAMAHALVSTEEPATTTRSTGDTLRDETRLVGQHLAALTRDVLGCRRVAISILDPTTGLLHPIDIVGLSPQDEEHWRATVEPSSLETADPDLVRQLLAGEVVLIDMTQPPYADQPNPYGARVILATLLRVRDSVVGALALDYGGEEHAYTPDELALAAAVSQLAALVTERERLQHEREEARANEAALREANRRMDEFLGIAGHEMRTPLTAIMGNLQLAQRRLARLHDAENMSAAAAERALKETQHLLERTDMQLNRMNRLVDDLLDVSRIRAGRLEVRRQPSDLGDIVRDIVYEQRAIAATRTIRLEMADDLAIAVHVDQERVGQVVMNYLTNALKYSSEESPVTVGLSIESGMARVWVRDEGPGLAAGEHERVWEQFYRAEGVVPRFGSGVGLGLGLHISKTIIEQHGGRVGVESTPGTGATFWFTIPLAEL